MISTFIFTKSSIAARLRAISPEWRLVFGVFALARIWFVIWPLVISAVVPVAVENLELSGAPVVAAFNLTSSEGSLYSRLVGGKILTFSPGEDGYLKDRQTESLWSLLDGHAISGAYTGAKIEASQYDAEEVFPYHGIPPDPSLLLSVWQRFDANWYLKIATTGYSETDGSMVYFPFYPFAIRFLGNFFPGGLLVAAILVSNLAFIGLVYFLYQIGMDIVGPDVSKRALFYLVIFPTSFFLFAPYTESLFLCLSLASLYSAQRRHWLWAGTLGALAALTRLQGVVLLLPLAYLFWKQEQGMLGRNPGSNVSHRRDKLLGAASLLLVPVASFSYVAASNSSLIANYQDKLHASFVLPWDNLGAAVTLIGQGRASVPDVLNLAATLFFAGMCAVVWANLPRQFGLYTFGMFLAPLVRMTTQQPLVSMTRYVLVLFPAYLVLANWGKNRWINRAVVYLSLPLNLYLSAQFFLWGWVA